MMAMDLAKLDALAPSSLEVDWRRFEQTRPREWRATPAARGGPGGRPVRLHAAGKLARCALRTMSCRPAIAPAATHMAHQEPAEAEPRRTQPARPSPSGRAVPRSGRVFVWRVEEGWRVADFAAEHPGPD